MSQKGTETGSMGRLNLSLPETTIDWLRDQAKAEGIPMQSIAAPILNAAARGEIKGGYFVVPDAHGNAKAGRTRRQAA